MRQRLVSVFEAAAAGGESAEVIEGLAQVAYLEHDYTTAIQDWERAYAAYRDARDELVGAVRAARTLGCMYGTVVGDWAVGSGWIARARTLVGDDHRLVRGGLGRAQRRHVRGRPSSEGGSTSARR